MFGQRFALLRLDHHHDHLPQAVVRGADCSHIVYLGVLQNGRFQLHGIDVLPAADDEIFFSVHEVNEPLLIHLPQITGMKPSVTDHRFREFRVSVVSLHQSVALDDDLAHLTPGHVFAVLSHDPCVPKEAWLADGAYFSLVFASQMNDPGSGGFA